MMWGSVHPQECNLLALPSQGQGLLHCIQLLHLLPYLNQFHIKWTGLFDENV
jgi:hypothetical protein